MGGIWVLTGVGLWLVRDKHVVLLPTRTGTKEEQTAVDQLLAAGKGGGGKGEGRGGEGRGGWGVGRRWPELLFSPGSAADTSVVEWGTLQVAGTGGVLAVTHKHVRCNGAGRALVSVPGPFLPENSI